MNILFTSVNNDPIAIKLIAVGEPTTGANKYTTDTLTSSQQYTVGDWITSESGFINFDYHGNSLNESNYYKFITSGGDIAISGNFNQGGAYYYYNMFKDSKEIVDASGVAFTFMVGKHGAQNMFANCTSLTSTPITFPELVWDWSYAGMFYGCTSLKYASCDLKGIMLGTYSWMFYNCTSLTGINNLPTQNIARQFCYNSMFQNCTSLKTFPLIPIRHLANGCMKNMFMGCKNLSSITVRFNDWNEDNLTDATENWVKGVASYGTFNKPNRLSAEYGNSRIPIGWDRTLQTITIDPIPSINLTRNNTSASITEYVHYSGTNNLTYMVNGQLPSNVTFDNGVFYYNSSIEHTSEKFSVQLIVFASDTKIEMINVSVQINYLPLTFKAVNGGANIQLSKVGSPSAVALDYSVNDGAWTNYSIGDVINLNLNDTVAFSGSNDYFSKDWSNYYKFAITGQIESYENIMSLVNYSDTIPIGAFIDLFKDCSGLLTAPDLLAHSVEQNGYAYMFRGCTSLSTAPVVCATTFNGSKNCAYMFSGCVSLTEAPELPATTLANSCYLYMFEDCSNLSSITVHFTDWNGGNSTFNWVNRVATYGKFYGPSSLSTVHGDSYIPTHWKSIINNSDNA